MNFLYFPIFLFGISLADPKILYLNKFFAGTTTYIANVEGYSALYLSSSDDIQLLKNITIDIGDSLTLDTLVNRKNADGSQKALTIGNVLSFTTTNSDAITQRLTGFIYVASAKQAADPDFSVYVIDGKYNITKSSSLSTTVILNTYYGLTPEYYAPDMNSYVDNIQQDKSAKIWLYSDIPFDNYTQKPAWGTFFYNPLVFDNIDENNNAYQTEQFFDNIEPLQISYDAWYILSNGKISLTIDKYWDNSLEDSTTSRTTTGLIINPPLGLFAKTKIYFQHDAHNNRTTGMYATSNVNSPVDVTFYSSQATLFAQFVGNKPIIGLQEWSPNDATSLFVNSSYLMPGQFSVQYFVIDGLSVYTLTSSSPSTVQTTTPKSSVTSTIQTTTSDSYLPNFSLTFLCLLSYLLTVMYF